MAEILSQNQIDELLNELASETIDEEKADLDEHIVKNYDFKSPKKMSREQNRALSNISEALGRHLAAYLAGVLRNYCEITVASIEEHPYYEYNNALPDALMTGVIDIETINAILLLDLSNSITFTLVDKMLGGSSSQTIIPEREFTEIEISLMERVFRRICSLLDETLVNITNPDVRLRQIETNSRFIKAIRNEEVVEVIVYNVSVDTDVKGTITMCIPYTYIEALTGNEKTNDKGDVSAASEELRKAMLSEFSNSYVDVSGIIGTAKLTLQDVMNLQPGDVIKLDQKAGSPVLITVNNNKWFWGELGIKKSQKAVRFSKYYKDRIEL